MKHNYLMLLLIASMVSLSLVACEKDPNNNNSDNNQSENGKPVVEMINDAVTDIDGNHYNAVKIGKQVWMSENLKTKHYADGTEIPVAIKTEEYSSQNHYEGSKTNPYVYNVDSRYYYNWSAVMQGSNSSNTNPSGIQGVCPDGWHVPSWAEWEELKNYVSGYTQFQCGSCETCIGRALAAYSGWERDFADDSCDVCFGNNTTGFSAKPDGAMRSIQVSADDIHTIRQEVGEYAYFWSATNSNPLPIVASLHCYNEHLSISTPENNIHYFTGTRLNESSGLSVRCVRN